MAEGMLVCVIVMLKGRGHKVLSFFQAPFFTKSGDE